jgi:predicted permease
VSVDWRVLTFTAAVSLLASVLCGTAPAWRLSSGNAADSLRQSGAATGGLSARRTRRLIVVVECALAVVLLAGAGLLIRSLALVRSIDPGVDASHVLLVRVNLPLPVSPQWRRQEWATFQQIEERIAQIPGVTHVGTIQNFLNPANPEEALVIEGSPGATGDTLVTVTDTTPGFFQAMGVPLVAGRFFTPQEQNTSVAIVNRSFATRFFGTASPIGRRFREGVSGRAVWYTIVGVVGDMRRQGLERDPLPEYYYCSSEPTMDVAVRTGGNPTAIAGAVRDAIRRVYPNTVVLSTATVDATLGDLGAQRSFQTWVLGAFAAVALALSAIGIYGVVHFSVAQRRQEIGIRLALGASRSDISRLILSQGMAFPVAGTVLGLIGAASLTRVMRHLLFRVDAADPATFAAVATVLLAVSLAACWLPARRAMRMDPLVALRHE